MNQEVLNKVFVGLRLLLIAIAAIMLIVLYMAEPGSESEGGISGTLVNYGLFLTVVTAIIGVFSAGFSIFINPTGVKNVLIGLGAFVVIIGLSYVLADGSDFEKYKEVTEDTSKMVSMGLNMFYITSLLALLSVVYSAVARIFK